MLQQDYFLRIIEEFAKALSLFKQSKKDLKQKQDEILKLYDTYVGDNVFYHIASMDDIMDSFTRFPEDERLERMEMLAELYYAESDLKSGPSRDMLLENARKLFIFIDHHSRTLSLQRQQRIIQIEKDIAKTTMQS
ncbi:MAG: hypothetical protein IKQ03_04120 [Prevotella sp.]|jgi:uncharacterized protein (DUF924 family)|nr:hypothetical protein [Prevotella sp.]